MWGASFLQFFCVVSPGVLLGTTDVRKKATTVSLCECFRKNFPSDFSEVRSSKCFPCYYSRAAKTFPTHASLPSSSCGFSLVVSAAARRQRRKSSHTSIQTKIFTQSPMSGTTVVVLRGGSGTKTGGSWCLDLSFGRPTNGEMFLLFSSEACAAGGDKTRKARGATQLE